MNGLETGPNIGINKATNDRGGKQMIPAVERDGNRSETLEAGSNRGFGLVMAAALGVVAAVNLWHHGSWWPWLAGVGVAFLLAALLFPTVLSVPNRLWFKFGMLLHHVVNPIIMGLVYYLTVLPTGLVLRALGKDMLRLRRDREADTYWIQRSPGPAPESMKDQF